MYQRDYILKLIEEAAKFFAKLLSLKNNGEQKEMLEIIYYSYQHIFGIDKNKSTEEIITDLQRNNRNSFTFVELLSDFINEEANVTNNLSLYQKSFELLLYVDENDKETFSLTRKNKLEKLAEILKTKITH